MRTLRAAPHSAVLALSVCLAAACGGASLPARRPGRSRTRGPGLWRVSSMRRVRRSPSAPTTRRVDGRPGALGGKTFAYIADEDDQAVHVVDVDAQKDVSKTGLAGKPAQLMFLADGRLVVAPCATRHRSRSSSRARRRASRWIPLPVIRKRSPTASRSRRTTRAIVVTSAWGKSLASFDAKSPNMAQQWEVALPREPRSVVVSDDGTHAFVAQAVGGQVSVVDLKVHQVIPTATHLTDENLKAAAKAGTLGRQRSNMRFSAFGGNGKGSSCQGFALAKTGNPGGRVLVPQALVDPGDPNENPSGYGSSRQDQAEVGDIAVIDEDGRRRLLASLLTTPASFTRQMQTSAGHDHQECLLPRSAAYDSKHKTLLVGCYGIDDVVAYDALAASPTRAIVRRWDVAAGPSGIAVDTDKDRAVVWSQFERPQRPSARGGRARRRQGAGQAATGRSHRAQRATHALPGVPGARPRSLPHGGRRAHLARRARVRQLSPGRPRRFAHVGDAERAAPEHHARGRVSANGALLVERDRDDAQAAHGHHLHAPQGQRRPSLDGARRARRLRPDADTAASVAPKAELAARVARGSEIFHSAATGCSSCHAGTYATDNDRHDVQSKASTTERTLTRRRCAPWAAGVRTSTTAATRRCASSSPTPTARWVTPRSSTTMIWKPSRPI